MNVIQVSMQTLSIMRIKNTLTIVVGEGDRIINKE